MKITALCGCQQLCSEVQSVCLYLLGVFLISKLCEPHAYTAQPSGGLADHRRRSPPCGPAWARSLGVRLLVRADSNQADGRSRPGAGGLSASVISRVGP